MKLNKIFLSTQLRDLYGKDEYQNHIKVGREYWAYVTYKSDDIKTGWYKIRITYIRSGCMFYVFSDHNYGEDYAPVKCFWTSVLEEVILDPIKELNFTESDEKLYYFNDERTKIINWSNEKIIETDDPIIYTVLSVMNPENKHKNLL